MLVIFSNRFDPVAQQLCEKWRTHNARMLTCSDLSLPGWRFYMETDEEAQAVIAGEVIPEKEIRGILTLWPAIYEQELTHIAAADRFYVANEMTAFLKAWLTQIPCPVLNRPSAMSLVGPGWRVEKWVNVAAQSGLVVAPIERKVKLFTKANRPTNNKSIVIGTVIGKHCYGNLAPNLKEGALRLAKAAGVEMLDVFFDSNEREGQFLGANLMPKFQNEIIIEAVRKELTRSKKRPSIYQPENTF